MTRHAMRFALFCLVVGCGANVVFVEDGDTTSSTGAGPVGGAPSEGGGGAGGATCDPDAHTMDPADYDLGCSQASDCTAVFLGNLCQGCTCPFGAINAADRPKYEADLAMKIQGAAPSVCSCPAMIPACEGGQCLTVTP